RRVAAPGHRPRPAAARRGHGGRRAPACPRPGGRGSCLVARGGGGGGWRRRGARRVPRAGRAANPRRLRPGGHVRAPSHRQSRPRMTGKEGGPLGQQQVIESQRRLGALGLFQRVSVAEVDPESAGQRTLLVSAEEAPLTTVAYGIGYSENDLLRGSLEVTRRNL